MVSWRGLMNRGRPLGAWLLGGAIALGLLGGGLDGRLLLQGQAATVDAEGNGGNGVIPLQAQTSPQAKAPLVGPEAPTGVFRVGNQTEHPVRIALLVRRSSHLPEGNAAKKAAIEPSVFSSEPVHWDFAPGEGERSGLVLSLAEGQLRLGRGDVLVVFAQDGSQRYWGPYVVGETPLPYWNAERQEWQLLVQP